MTSQELIAQYRRVDEIRIELFDLGQQAHAPAMRDAFKEAAQWLNTALNNYESAIGRAVLDEADA